MVQDGSGGFNRIQVLSDDIKNANDLDSVREPAEVIVKLSQLQSSITSSLKIVVDTVLKQNKIMACNMLLFRRDKLLKDCSSKLGLEYLANLCTEPFDPEEVFDSDMLSQVEDNMLKRISSSIFR